MQRYQEVIERIIALTETMEEGLRYSQECCQAEQYEQGRKMLLDVFEAFYQIEKSMAPFFANLSTNMIKEYHAELREHFDRATGLLEGKSFGTEELFTDRFVLNFQEWKREICRCLQPLTILEGDRKNV